MNDNRALRRFLRNMGNGTIPEDWDEAQAMLERIEQREQRLRAIEKAAANYLEKTSDPMCPPLIRQIAIDALADALKEQP